MHKSFYIFTSLLILVFFETNGQNSFVSDSTAKRLEIKTVIKNTFFGEEETPSMTYTEFYDKNGKVTKEISYNNHFNSISICKYFSYNNEGQLNEEKSIHFNDNDTLSDTMTYTYTYNSKGQLDYNFFGEIKYKYDSLGRVIEKVEKTVKPSDFITNYFYDSLGLLIKIENYMYETLEHNTTFIYNKQRQKITEISTFYMPKSEYERTFLYNEKGLITTEFQKQTITSRNNKPDNRKSTYEYSFY